MADKNPTLEDAQFYSELLRAYFDSANDAIFVLCDEMKFLTCNKMTEQWLGFTEKQLTEHNQRTPIIQLLGDDYDVANFSRNFKSALNGHTASFETFIKPDGGHQRWAEISLTKVDIDGGNLVIAVARDISERKKHLATIDYQNHFDALTGLPNRNSLKKYLLEQKSNLLLFTISLERFSEINKSLGQEVGDSILVEISRRLQRITDTESGEFIARFGGVKFALALPGIALEASQDMAQTIRQLISQPVIRDSGKVSVDCGIGIASSAVHSSDRNTLIQLSEAAMQTAKTEKLGVSIYDPDSFLESADHLQMVNDLREALSAGEIHPFYQPIVSMHTGEIHVEALARWKHPEHGYIPPDKFVFLAEENGLINQLTTQILKASIANCSSLLDQKIIERLSINLSPYCLSNAGLVDEIHHYLSTYSVSASSITLELTESSVMSSISVTQKTLAALHELGISFSIDDFGTGYSSLSKLKQMTLKELKIDKTFVMDIVNNENDAAITNASIQMAHGLGLDVVAEGIEDEATCLRLKEMGCDYAQGYWIAKPMPFAALQDWLVAQ